MKWYKNLYLGETIAPKARQIMKKINKNKPVMDVYLITLPSNPAEQLDLIPSWVLLQKGYPTEHIRVVGMAKGREEAMQLVVTLAEEVYEKTGEANITEYLKNKWRESL